MPVTFSQLQIGSTYDRQYLASLWGYKSFQALGKGAVTPTGTPYIIFFITAKRRGVDDPYQNSLEDGVLRIEGERQHGSDSRIINALGRNDQIHLFYRERDHTPFVYHGQVFLVEHVLYTERPSQFVFAVGKQLTAVVGAILTEDRTHGADSELFIPDEEGDKITRQHVTYERSRRNRARALDLHGFACVVCGFDFNSAYGEDWADSFIEVHHVNSLAGTGSVSTNPETDLVPVCSNCHSMLHRRRNHVLSVNDLRDRISKPETKRTHH